MLNIFTYFVFSCVGLTMIMCVLCSYDFVMLILNCVTV